MQTRCIVKTSEFARGVCKIGDVILNVKWETDFYPVRVLGSVVLSLCGCQTPAQHWIKILHPWVQEFYPVLGLGSGGRLLRHFQTPTLYVIHFSP